MDGYARTPRGDWQRGRSGECCHAVACPGSMLRGPQEWQPGGIPRPSGYGPRPSSTRRVHRGSVAVRPAKAARRPADGHRRRPVRGHDRSRLRCGTPNPPHGRTPLLRESRQGLPKGGDAPRGPQPAPESSCYLRWRWSCGRRRSRWRVGCGPLPRPEAVRRGAREGAAPPRRRAPTRPLVMAAPDPAPGFPYVSCSRNHESSKNRTPCLVARLPSFPTSRIGLTPNEGLARHPVATGLAAPGRDVAVRGQ